MAKSDVKALVKTACKKIENIIDDLICILELLKKENTSIGGEMTSMVLCKQKTISLCENTLLTFRDVVRLKYTYVSNLASESNHIDAETLSLEKRLNGEIIKAPLEEG